MSLGLTHFAVGAGAMALVLAVVAPTVRYRAGAMVASGLWALVPDVHYVVPGENPLLFGLKHTVVGNLFWFHGAMDAAETGRGSRGMAGLALGFLVVAVLLLEARRYLAERDTLAAAETTEEPHVR